jgi:cation transport regulator
MSYYPDLSTLPDDVRKSLPLHARVIYMNAYNSAWDVNKEADRDPLDSAREDTASEMAWAAVMKVYEKEAHTGHWKRKTVSIAS